MGRRAAVGTGSVGVAGVRRTADISTGGGTTGIVGELHQIDIFTITDDSDDTFELTFDPAEMSWNPSLGGVMLEEGTDYTISGKTLTVLDPTDLFRGADTQGPPWQLRVQYDYLVGQPGTLPADLAPVSGTSAAVSDGVGSVTATFAEPPAAGVSVVVATRAGFDDPVSSVSGLGATWTSIASVLGSGGTATRPMQLWLGTGCNGSGDTVTAVCPNGAIVITAIDLDNGLTSAGAQTDTAVNTSAGDSLTATSAGLGVIVWGRNSGYGTVTDTPLSGWTVQSGGTGTPSLRLAVQPVPAGLLIDSASTITVDQYIVAVIHQ